MVCTLLELSVAISQSSGLDAEKAPISFISPDAVLRVLGGDEVKADDS